MMMSNVGGIEADGDDSEESSSSLATMPNQFRSALDDFRQQWQRELKSESKQTSPSRDYRNKTQQLHQKDAEVSDEIRAEQLFLQGAELEQRGKVYDALRYYRRAVQIVPDIEFRIYEAAKKAKQAGGSNKIPSQDTTSKIPEYQDDGVDEVDAEDEDLSNVDLYLRFQNAILKSDALISRANAEKGILITGAHLSDLPMEIILYILRWVVSAQLDFRSLEQCASVCKGFYLCARDQEIWRLACLKVWGVNTGILQNSPYNTWRDMFIHRQRVHFHGCYISKTSYMRLGENSFQDQFYRPVQIVEYYRYIRFFPDGLVLMMTSADDPSQAVGKLYAANTSRPEILRGHYRLHGEQVVIVLKRLPKTTGGKKRNANNNDAADDIQTFFIELNVASGKRKKFNQLVWKSYSFIQTKNNYELQTEFELTSAKYPPFWFSRVKSYHLESDAPLQ